MVNCSFRAINLKQYNNNFELKVTKHHSFDCFVSSLHVSQISETQNPKYKNKDFVFNFVYKNYMKNSKITPQSIVKLLYKNNNSVLSDYNNVKYYLNKLKTENKEPEEDIVVIFILLLIIQESGEQKISKTLISLAEKSYCRFKKK